jgi:quinol monooxygenase YgiN
MPSFAATNSAFLAGSVRAPARARGRATRVATRVHASHANRRSLFVRVPIQEGKMKEYETLIRKHISLCFMNDRCMYFDYGISEDKPNVVNLYEVYEDEDALAEHKKSAHLAEYLEAAKDLVDGQSEVTEMTLALAEFGSVNCNYAGECELGEYAWGE